jgi:anti-sigma-K factor RskA
MDCTQTEARRWGMNILVCTVVIVALCGLLAFLVNRDKGDEPERYQIMKKTHLDEVSYHVMYVDGDRKMSLREFNTLEKAEKYLKWLTTEPVWEKV